MEWLSSGKAFITDVRQYDVIEHRHSHLHHQIILPLSGALELDIGGLSGKAYALQGAVVPGDFQHTFRGVGNNRFVVLDLVPDQNADQWPDEFCRLLETPKFFPLETACYHYTQIVSAVSSSGALDAQLSALLANLLIELFSRRRTANMTSPVRLARRLGPTLAYIHSHFDQQLPVNRLAALSYLSIGQFHALFRNYTGCTPGQYVTELRMQRASSLLQETSWPINQIAAAVGYGSQAAFTNAFKRYFGLSPNRYRRKI